MFSSWARFASSSGALIAGLMVCLALLAFGLAAWRHLRRKPDMEEIERRRRAAVNRDGKIGVGEIMDVDAVSSSDAVSIVYSYRVAGVVYTASQEIVAHRPGLPPDLMTMVGPVSVKFDPRNPANSMVYCDDWSGLRLRESTLSRPRA